MNSGALLEEIVGHLGAAKVQLIPSDDRIIAAHIEAAHSLAVVMLRFGFPAEEQIGRLREKLGAALAGPSKHRSDCAVHNAPAYEPGPCDCGARTPTDILEAMVSHFDFAGCTCTFPSDKCCAYAEAQAMIRAASGDAQ